MTTDKALAADWFDRLFNPAQWQIEARLNDGQQPLYEVEKIRRQVWLNLHEGQMQAWHSQKRFVFIIAGTQSGKTSFLPWLLAREIQRQGPGDYLAATSTYDLFKLKLLPSMLEIFEHELRIGRYWAGDNVIEIADPAGKFWANRSADPMYARVILRSAVAKGGLESASAKAALLDEVGQDEFSLTAFEAVRRRLSLSRGRIFAGTTPYNLGWLKQQIYDRWERREIDYVDVIQFASTMNPLFSQQEFEEARATMPDWKFRMFYAGLFTRPAGQIYGDFVDEDRDKGGHKVKRFAIPREWARYVAVDPGIINTAKLWAAHDPQADIYYVYREELGERKPATEHAQAALSLARANGERVVKWAVGAKSEKYWREDFSRAGCSGVVGPDVDDVEVGIDRVIQLLKQFRIYFFDDLSGLLDEMVRYSRELDDEGQPTAKIKDKAKFHRLDALRYLCIMLVKGPPKPRKARSKRYA